jgi:phospholipase C
VPVPPKEQSLPKQEAGIRRARPLPYNLAVSASVGADGVSLEFSNRGRAGAVFHSRARTAGQPIGMRAQMFTVEAGRRLSTTVATSPVGYEVEIHGPNGFYRRLSGGAAPGPEVTAAPVGSSQDLQLVITNAGPAVELTISDDRSPGLPTNLQLPQGGRITHLIGGHTNGWYDVTITSSGDPRFIRQLAGHVENGRPSISDPTLAA